MLDAGNIGLSVILVMVVVVVYALGVVFSSERWTRDAHGRSGVGTRELLY